MSSWLIATIGFVYLYIGVDLIIKGQVGMGIAYLGYSLGKVGLYLEAVKEQGELDSKSNMRSAPIND